MKALRVCVLALTLFPSLTSRAEDSNDWNSWRGAERNGKLSEALPSSLSDTLALVWQKSHGPSYSGPIIHGGLVFTTETVDKRLERVTAYRVSDGEMQWQQEWEGSMAVPFFAAANGDWIRSTPACSKGGLVVVGMRDVMACFDPDTGKERWRKDFVNDMGTPLPMFGASSSPLIDGDRVIMQTGGATVCLSLNDGSLLWQTLRNAEAQSPGAFSSPMNATIQGVRQLLVQTRTELCGVDLQSGEVLWNEPIATFRGMNILTPLVIGNRVYTSAYQGNTHCFEIDFRDGNWSSREVWQSKHQAYMSSPVVIGSRIYMFLRNERLVALDAETGSEVFVTKPIAKYASLISDGANLLALTNDGTLMLVDGQSDEFRVIDKMKVADDSWAHLAISGPFLIVRDLKELKVYRIKT